MVKTQVSSKGQTTIPIHLRNRWRASQVIWISNPDGSALVKPSPDVMALFGRAGSDKPQVASERELAADEIVREVVKGSGVR